MLLDVLGPDPKLGPASAQALRTCLREGRLVACEIVWAEVTGEFSSPDEAEEALAAARWSSMPSSSERRWPPRPPGGSIVSGEDVDNVWSPIS